MKKKFNLLAGFSFALALIIFSFTYYLYHYLSPNGGFTAVFQETPAKPFVTLLFGIWGVFFLFASVASLIAGVIFSSKK